MSSVQELMGEALNDLFKKYGKPEIGYLSRSTKTRHASMTAISNKGSSAREEIARAALKHQALHYLPGCRRQVPTDQKLVEDD